MSKLLTISRRNELLSIIQENSSANVSDLAKLFKVSTETIRKDLVYLESNGLVIRGHGGAIIPEGHYDLPIKLKLLTHSEPKKAIARKTAELIPDKSSIYIGPGSTETMIAKQLINRPNIKIFTNSIMIAQLYCDRGTENRNFLLFGGTIEAISMSTVGSLTLDSIDSMFFDYAILGTSGFEKMEGPSTFSYGELAIAKKVLQKSRKTIIIGDSSKFEKTSLFMYARWEDVDLLVTNNDPDLQPLMDKISKKVEIVLAD